MLTKGYNCPLVKISALHGGAQVLDSKAVVGVEQIIKLGAGVSIDGYMVRTPDGWSFRYGLNYISTLMGYSRAYYLRVTKNGGNTLEALQYKGYTGDIVSIKVYRDGKRGSSLVKTVSFDDLCLIIELEAEKGNPKAIALLTASFRELLRSRTQNAFGLDEDTLEQKQLNFQFNYQDYLEDRAELEDLKLPGDEENHLVFWGWRDISPWGVPYFDKEALFTDYL